MDLQGYGYQLALGALTTLEVAFSSALVGVLLGILWAAAKLSPIGWLRVSVSVFTSLLRGVPEFVILLVCYYGLQGVLVSWHIDFDISPFIGGVFALSIVFAAYTSEVFRGAFLAVPKGQLEAARSFGMKPNRIFFRIHLPQAWRLALPSLNNLWQNVLKDTSLVSVIGLEDVMQHAHEAANATRQPFNFFVAASLIYLVFWALSAVVFSSLERRASRGLAR